MSNRKDFPLHPFPGVHVTGWNRHTYFAGVSCPPSVDVYVRPLLTADLAQEPQGTIDTTVNMSMTIAQARQLAAAITTAADNAEAAPDTDDTPVAQEGSEA